MGNNIISPIIDLVRDITAPIVSRIKDAIRRKLAEAQEIAQQLGESVDDVMGQPNLATAGAGGTNPGRVGTNQPVQTTGAGGQLRPAIPSTVVNDLRNFSTRTFRFGNETFQLDKSGMKHILERHHPRYWNGTARRRQTFLDRNMSIDDVADAVLEVMKQNREIIIEEGTNSTHQIEGVFQSITYVFGFRNGRIGQFYPK